MLQPLNPKTSSVLIVEDSPDDAFITSRALEAFGIRRTLFAETAEEALTVLEREECDVAIVDYNLPGMNGLRLLERIRELRPGVQVIIMTRLREERIAVSVMKAGAADYVTKDDSLTSSVIRSLQATLRGRVTAAQEHRRATLAPSDDSLRAALAKVEWQLELLHRPLAARDDGGIARSQPGYGDEAMTELREAFERYAVSSFARFPEPPRAEEEALVHMLFERGCSPTDVLVMYTAALRSLLLAETTPPFDPTLTALRVLALLLDEYQRNQSLGRLGRDAA